MSEKRERGIRWRPVVWLAAIVVFLYVLFVLPFMLVRNDPFRAWILDTNSGRTLPKDWSLRIGRVDRFDPGGIRMRNIRLEHRTPDGIRPWAELGRLSIDFRLAPLFRRRIRASELVLDSLVIHVDEAPPVFARAGSRAGTPGRGLQELPSIRVGRFVLRRVDVRNARGSIARGDVVLHDLRHLDGAVGAEVDTVRGEMPSESLLVALIGGRVRGQLPDHFTVQGVGLATQGLHSRIDATARLGRGNPDSTLATLDWRIDGLRPARIPRLARYHLPVEDSDSLRGWARVFYASRRTSAIVSVTGAILGAPLDSLEARVAQRGDTLELQSMSFAHRAGSVSAAGRVILDSLRVRGHVDFSGVDLTDSSLRRWLPKPLRIQADGHIQGRARLGGGDPDVGGEVTIPRLIFQDKPLPSIHLVGRLAHDFLTIDSLRAGDPGAGLAATGAISLDDRAIQIRARLTDVPLDQWVGPWVHGVPFEGTAGGELTVGGNTRSPWIRGRLRARDFQVAEVRCTRIDVDSIAGTLVPMDLVAHLRGQGMNIYGVGLDTTMIDMAWTKTMRVGLEVRKDSLLATADVDLVPAEPGFLTVERLDLEPGSLAPWSMTEKPRVSWKKGASTIEGVRFESTEGLVTGDLSVGAGSSSMTGSAQVEELNLDFLRMLLGLPDSTMVGTVSARARIGGTPLRPALQGTMDGRDLAVMTWPVGPMRTNFMLDESGTIRLDSLAAGRGAGYGRVRIPSLTLALSDPLPAFTRGLKDSLPEFFDRTAILGTIEVDDLALNRIIHTALAGMPANGSNILAEPIDPMMTRIRTVRAGDNGNGVTLEKAVQGDVWFDLSLSGTAGRPEGAVHGRVGGLQVYQARADSVLFSAGYRNQSAVLDSLVWFRDGKASRAAGNLPLVASLVPGRTAVVSDRPLAFDAELPEIDLAILSALSKQILDPSGILSGSIQLRGTPRRLWPEGALAIRDGGLRIPNREERLRAITGSVSLDSTGVRIESLTGAVGREGKIEVGGWFRDLNHFELDGKVTRATAFESGLYRFTFGGDLSAYPIVSPLGSYPQVVGTVNIIEGAIIGDMAKAPLPPTSAKRKPSPWHAEIDVQAPSNIRMSTAIASVDLGEGELHVSFIDPLLNVSGGIKVLGGRYRIFNNVFSITSGTVEFRDLGRGLEPILDIYADTQVSSPAVEGEASQDTNIKIHVTGPILDLKVEFSSDPARTEDEIVSLLVMGQLTNPTTGAVGIVDPSRQYLFTELVAQIESQISQLVLPLGNVSLQPGAAPGSAWKLNVRQTLLPQVSVAYSRELAQAAGEEVSLRYNLKGKLYLNAGLQRKLDAGQVTDRYSLDLKLRFEYK
jgi:hypothetical protein